MYISISLDFFYESRRFKSERLPLPERAGERRELTEITIFRLPHARRPPQASRPLLLLRRSPVNATGYLAP